MGTIDANSIRFSGTGTGAGQEGPCATCDNIDSNAFDWAGTRGIGDIEVVCTPQTYYIEIGNRVWIDTDEDGIQDADEGALANISIELVAPDGTVLATTITDADGNYFFSSAPGTSADRVCFNHRWPSLPFFWLKA